VLRGECPLRRRDGRLGCCLNPNDIAHVSTHLKARDDGTGQTTGASYKLDDEENSNQNVKLVSGTAEVSLVFNEKVVGRGAVPNTMVKMTMYLTANANGTVTVERTKIELDCTG
jgi:hypothetical protein